jgi:uncharacterized protein (DUF1015 family)
MATLFPFRGVRYDPARADLTKVICPPYDIISPEAQNGYYSQDEHNIIRVELGLAQPDDRPGADRYSRAAAYLTTWLTEGILAPEARPALYLYKMDYAHPYGGTRVLKGMLCLVQLEALGAGKILPHEWTFPKAKQDRLALLRACQANTSPIFSIFSDPEDVCIGRLEAAAGSAPADMDVVQNGTRHRVWAITDAAAIAAVAARLAPQPLFIADGHHRYETALNYQKERRAEGATGPQPFDNVMMFCANMDDPGLALLPIHRIVLNPLPVPLETLRARLAQQFTSETLAPAGSPSATKDRLIETMRHAGSDRTAFGVITGQPPKFELLTLKQPSARGERAVERLDVTCFQHLVLEQALGIEDSAATKESRIQFIKDEAQALQLLASGAAGVIFLLNPTRIDQVRDVVLSGDRMPQKSTYFYPKPVTGLVLNKF